jgi:hypothetical protein
MAGKRVVILTHDNFRHPSGVVFEPRRVKVGDIEQFLGVAENVDAALVREHFRGRPDVFLVEGYDEESPAAGALEVKTNAVTVTELPFNPEDVTLAELPARVAGVDNPKQLQALMDADTRKGAQALYKERLAAVESGEQRQQMAETPLVQPEAVWPQEGVQPGDGTAEA